MFSLQKLKRIDYSTAVSLRIRRRLSTAIGSYEVMIQDSTGLFLLDSDYGSYLPTYVSRPNSSELVDLIKQTVETSLSSEPILLNEVVVKRADSNKVDIIIDYKLIDSNEDSSLVFSLQ